MVDEIKKQKDLTTKKQLLNEALDRAMEDGTMAEVRELKKQLKEMSPPPEILKKIFEKRKKKKDIDRTEEYFDFKEGKKDESYNVMEAAKGGEVKGYMGGGEVRMDDSPNSGMITQRGWGASRKT
jgi:hypothetical protein